MNKITVLSEYKVRKEQDLKLIVCGDCNSSNFEIFSDNTVFCSDCEVRIDADIDIKTVEDWEYT